MAAELSGLVRLGGARVGPAAEMLAAAFHDDPLYAYLLPDEAERRRKSRYLHEFFLRYGLAYGEVYATSPGLEGVAVWLPPQRAHPSQWRAMRTGALSLTLKLGRKFISRQVHINNYILPMHKRHAPFRHWYLFHIGVAPDFQGRGYGGALLKAMLARIDGEGLPCYLETQKEKNVAFYRHYGFAVAGRTDIPGTGFSQWAMLREKSD